MSKPFRKINLVLDSVIAFSFNGLAMAGNIVANLLLTLAVSKPEMGILVLFNQTVTLFSNILAFGLGSTSVYIIGKNQNVAWRIVVTISTIFAILLSLGIFILWLSRNYWLSRYFDGLEKSQWILVLLIGGMMAGGAIYVGILRGIGETPIASFVNRFINVLRPMVYAILFYTGTASVSNVIRANGMLALFMFILGVGLVVRALQKLGHLNLSKCSPSGLMGEGARYALIVLAGNTLLALSSRAGLYALNDLIGDKELIASFGVALIMVQAMLVFPVSLSATIFAKTSTDQEGNVERTIALAHRLVLVGMIVLAIVSYPIAFYGLKVIADGAYSDSFIQYSIMSLGIPFGVTNYILINYYSGRGRIGLASFGLLIGVVGNISFSYIMIPILGMQAASYAFVLSNMLGAVFMVVWFLREYSGIGLSGMIFLRYSDIKLIKSRLFRKKSILNRN